MNAAIVTVGNELLAGDIENTNATWLAAALADRGVNVARVIVVPDDEPVVAARIRAWAAEFDAVLVTGGLGGTPDDVTMPAVAAGLDRELIVDPLAETEVGEKIDRIYEENPDLGFELRPEWYASMPANATPIPNSEGLAPGCVADNVYVLPGIPEEMKAVFDNVAGDFAGDVVTRTVYSPEPEGALASPLGELTERFEVRVGSYPNQRADRTRITVTGGGNATVSEAVSWLRERAEISLESASESAADNDTRNPAESG
ncbi:competence damage-inducible protein A [Halobellus salinus]|uniref:Competence damage-inducible protein A n=1 Tax=Halobellus salinus TaxID=931585 RepID=A0A830ECU5_9EURY|nr:molybdopterin-binding protein [Halobellus salinus]GGJ13012.1 competence damage-inducible protein A [Halobellus salinus]SMP32417.1 molybdenum cofactor synthesis domain-containing protein [Halobellus salinus]